MPQPHPERPIRLWDLEFAPDDLRLLTALKEKLDALFAPPALGEDTPRSRSAPIRTSLPFSLDEALRAGLQRILEEELSPS